MILIHQRSLTHCTSSNLGIKSGLRCSTSNSQSMILIHQRSWTHRIHSHFRNPSGKKRGIRKLMSSLRAIVANGFLTGSGVLFSQIKYREIQISIFRDQRGENFSEKFRRYCVLYESIFTQIKSFILFG